MFNRGVVPAIPEQGSVGASGDLAPLAHLALVVDGRRQAFITKPLHGDAGRRQVRRGFRAAGRHLQRAHLKPHKLQAKEGLSLINGTQISTALLADALVQAWHLARIADIAGAMTVEATRSSQRPFDARIQEIRPHPGQAACAANLRRLLRRQRNHGLARRLCQGAGRLQHALHAAGPRRRSATPWTHITRRGRASR